MPRFQFIGDSHGRWDTLGEAVLAYPEADHVIQVGDIGYFPHLGSYPEDDFPTHPSGKVLFIDGNHDDILSLKSGFSHPALEYVQRGTLRVLSGVPVAFLGGGKSLDARNRVEGRDWFREEIPSWSEQDDFLDAASQATIIVTHETPWSLNKSIGYVYHESEFSDSLDRIWTGLKKKPRYWICGHHHRFFTRDIGGTRFVVVPTTHHYKGEPGCQGVVLDL